MNRAVRAPLHPIWFVAAIAAAAHTSPAQPARTVALSKPDATLTEAFTSILSIRELPDGRVIVSDSRDKVVQLVPPRFHRAIVRT